MVMNNIVSIKVSVATSIITIITISNMSNTNDNNMIAVIIIVYCCMRPLLAVHGQCVFFCFLHAAFSFQQMNLRFRVACA